MLSDEERAIDAADWTPPNIYPCGCSRHKVAFGLCDCYAPGERPGIDPAHLVDREPVMIAPGYPGVQTHVYQGFMLLHDNIIQAMAAQIEHDILDPERIQRLRDACDL